MEGRWVGSVSTVKVNAGFFTNTKAWLIGPVYNPLLFVFVELTLLILYDLSSS
jgi:hypothetical protein